MASEMYKEIKKRIEQAKNGEVPFSEKLKVYLAGVIYGLLQNKSVTLNEAEELEKMIGVDIKSIAGIQEFVIYGDIIDHKDSPLEFDKTK